MPPETLVAMTNLVHEPVRRQRFTSIHEPLTFDEDGFLADSARWSPIMACLIQAMDRRGTLEADHWSVIYHLREHYGSYGALPPVAQLCHDHGMKKERIKQLFGSCRNAWRTAGLPNPGLEALAHMA